MSAVNYNFFQNESRNERGVAAAASFSLLHCTELAWLRLEFAQPDWSISRFCKWALPVRSFGIQGLPATLYIAVMNVPCRLGSMPICAYKRL